jgi:CBS domain-containing protein
MPIYQAIELISRENLSVLPVIGENGILTGTIGTPDLIRHFNEISGIHLPGGTLMLEVPSYSYSLAEIARLAESNNAHILTSYIQQIQDSNSLRVFLKVNITHLNSIIATYERFGYTVVSWFQETDFDFYAERYKALMNFLSI